MPFSGEEQGVLACCSPWGRRVGHSWTGQQQLSPQEGCLWRLHWRGGSGAGLWSMSRMWTLTGASDCRSTWSKGEKIQSRLRKWGVWVTPFYWSSGKVKEQVKARLEERVRARQEGSWTRCCSWLPGTRRMECSAKVSPVNSVIGIIPFFFKVYHNFKIVLNINLKYVSLL